MTNNVTIKFIYHNHSEFKRKDAFTTENLHEKFRGRLSAVKMAGRSSGDFEKGQGCFLIARFRLGLQNIVGHHQLYQPGKKG